MFSNPSHQSNESNTQQTCPHCGELAPASAFICPHCNKNLLQDVSAKAFDEFADFEKPPLARTLLVASALALLLFLSGLILLDYETIFGRSDLANYARYTFLVIAILFLAIFAARGRRPNPKPLNYLVALVIVVIPLIGTLYGLFYAGRALAKRRLARTLVYVLLLILAATVFLGYGGDQIAADAFERLDLTFLNFLNQDSTQYLPTIEPTQPSTTPIPTKAPTKQRTTEPANEPAAEIEPTEQEASPTTDITGCIPWSEVTLDDVDRELCVYGNFTRTFKKDENTWVMIFSEEPGAFQIWSYPKDIAAYLPEDGATCIMARGWIKTTGVRPFIELRIFDELLPCPE
jgi:hypothetical protein